MAKISIVSLIYRSSRLAETFYNSLLMYTPLLRTGEAEFFFIANDPSQEVLDFLKEKKYPYKLNVNEVKSEEELFRDGYGKPEYMSRVYRGYNQGIMQASGQQVVLVNSDNFFSPDWLENLLKYSAAKNIISSTLIEPGHYKHGVFPSAIQKNFGNTIDNYNEKEFIKYAKTIKMTGIVSGGAYMPCVFYKDLAIYAGLYPEGNIAGKDFETVAEYGDIYFFKKLENLAVKHYTALDSVVYHLKEGEKDATDETETPLVYVGDRLEQYPTLHSVTNSDFTLNLYPTDNHNAILDLFLQGKTQKQNSKKGKLLFLKRILPRWLKNILKKLYMRLK